MQKQKQKQMQVVWRRRPGSDYCGDRGGWAVGRSARVGAGSTTATLQESGRRQGAECAEQNRPGGD
jgi:hypothetical protein